MWSVGGFVTVGPFDSATTVSVSRAPPGGRLIVYMDSDTGRPGDGREVDLTVGRAMVDADWLFGRRGKLILKLVCGSYLVDQAIVVL